jgi:S-formylglutathione hydrolase FrmB
MALCELHWGSQVIGKNVGAYVYLPDDAPPPFPTFYLLHGLSDDYTIWLRRTGIERYAARHGLMVVMPDGFRGFYTANADGPDYASYIARELVARVERIFPARRERAARGIGGLSMGGYGALRLALGFGEVFSVATSHSGAVMHGSRNEPRAGGALQAAEFKRIFGQEPAGTDHDVVALARRAAAAGAALPHIRIDCGVDDGLIADNRELHQKLTALKVPHEYEEFPGAHNWDYWDLHVQEALAFQARHLA